MNMEAYIPLHSAMIAYEVAKGAVDDENKTKLSEHFALKVIKPLEKNCLRVCDPMIRNQIEQPYRMLGY